jgi:hypothetical protein
MRSTGCVEEKLGRNFMSPVIHSCYPQQQLREAPARRRKDCYDSTVCSNEGAALQRVAEAIERLEADRGNTDAADLEARIAAIWSMVAEIDPELARLASRYGKPS